MSTEIKIDKGVPLPKDNGKGPPRKYPKLSELEVGDSFAVPAGDNYRTLSAYFRVKAQRERVSITARKSDTELRVWRVA